jgi:acyl-CoA thioesterase I
MIARLILLSTLFFYQCQHQPFDEIQPIKPKEKVDILALGDSYTLGQSVVFSKNFPNQLIDSLRRYDFSILGTRVIAQTGWRTDNLKNAIAAANDISDSTFSLVTLLIGVNNQFQNGSFDIYKVQFEELLNTAIIRAGNRKERVIVISIPDYAFTPFGQNYANPNDISVEIDEYNAVNKSISTDYGVDYVDITQISRQGLINTVLVASDNLHPSSEQYTIWVNELLPIVINKLQ